MDHLSRKGRSRVMSAIRSKNTKPEVRVRRVAHRLGFRFRLHDAALPGKPDIVLKRHKAVIFVNGCFWHSHACPVGMRKPSSNLDYWAPKLARTVDRDRAARERLEQAGWRVLVLWECEIQDEASIADRLVAFLRPAPPAPRQA